MSSPIVHELVTPDGKRFHRYWCPGCDTLHMISINPSKNQSGAGWTFSGTLDKPTYAPSQLTTWRQGEKQTEHRCHTFIRGGQIEFLSDCTHSLKGKTVDMVPLPDWVLKEGSDD